MVNEDKSKALYKGIIAVCDKHGTEDILIAIGMVAAEVLVQTNDPDKMYTTFGEAITNDMDFLQTVVVLNDLLGVVPA